MEVLLARLDALRRKGSDHIEELQQAFRAAVELLQVTTAQCSVVLSRPKNVALCCVAMHHI